MFISLFSLAGACDKTVIEYLHLNEHFIFQQPLLDATNPTAANEIFHSEAIESNCERKRRTSSTSDNESVSKRPKVGLSLLSPTLLQSGHFASKKDLFPQKFSALMNNEKLAIVPGFPNTSTPGARPATGESGSTKQDQIQNNDDEWKNVQVVTFSCTIFIIFFFKILNFKQ